MKIILLFTCALTLLATTGCLVSDGGGGRGRWHRGGRSSVIIGPPSVILPVPVIVVP